MIFTEIQKAIRRCINTANVDSSRTQSLIKHIEKLGANNVNLLFVCTHNSRRSQFAQVWAKVAASYFDINIQTYSGGTEVTAVYPSVIKSLREAGFVIRVDARDTEAEVDNPFYKVYYSYDFPPIELYSKLAEDALPKTEQALAIMTCNDAEENCPVITNVTQRIPLSYIDPKMHDGTHVEIERYAKTSCQIATEMLHVFSKISELVYK